MKGIQATDKKYLLVIHRFMSGGIDTLTGIKIETHRSPVGVFEH
jgi:hypothetical protein